MAEIFLSLVLWSGYTSYVDVSYYSYKYESYAPESEYMIYYTFEF